MLALGYRVERPTGTIALQGIRDPGSTDPVSDTILCELVWLSWLQRLLTTPEGAAVRSPAA